MHLQTTVTFYGLIDKRIGRIVEGSKRFLEEHSVFAEEKQQIHGVSYSDSATQTDFIEVYVDAICHSAQHHFSRRLEEAVVSMLTEELLGLVCLTEVHPNWQNRRMGWMLTASIIDEVVADVLGSSFCKKARERAAHHLLPLYTQQ
jgi:hypothetical protein